MSRIWPSLLLAVALAGCSSDGSGRKGAMTDQPAASQPIAIDSAQAAKKAVGKPVRVEGTARNAKLSAVVVRGDLLVYCLDRDSWPADRDGKKVAVTGTLEYTTEFQAQVSPSGEVSQGTEGGVFVLRTSQVQ